MDKGEVHLTKIVKHKNEIILNALQERKETLAKLKNPSLFVKAELNRLSYFIAQFQAAPMAGMEPVQLEVWTLHGAKDYLCTQYDGTIWEVFSGPHPETDTHPNCKCTREPFAGTLSDIRGQPPPVGVPPLRSDGRTAGGVTGTEDIPIIPIQTVPLYPIGPAAIWINEVERARQEAERARRKREKERERDKAADKEERERLLGLTPPKGIKKPKKPTKTTPKNPPKNP